MSVPKATTPLGMKCEVALKETDFAGVPRCSDAYLVGKAG